MGKTGKRHGWRHWLGLAESIEHDRLPFRPRRVFLSLEQVRLYKALQSAISDWAVICPKMGLGQIVTAHSGRHEEDHTWMEQISALSVDFLLCDPHTLAPLLGIVLQREPTPDETARQTHLRQHRDELVDAILASAELPLARIAAQDDYSLQTLGSYLKRKAGLSDEASTGHAEPNSTGALPPAGAP